MQAANPFKPEHDADVVAGHGQRRQNRPANRADKPGDHEGEQDHALHVDADQGGGLLVERAGQHALAVDGRGEEELEADQDEHGDRKNPDRLGENGGAEHLQGSLAAEGRQDEGVLAPQEHDEPADEDRDADGDDDQVDRRRSPDRPNGQALDQRPDHGRDQHGDENGRHEFDPDDPVQPDGEHARRA
jgi:hypothetical protein